MTRKLGEGFSLDGPGTVRIVEIRSGRVVLHIEAEPRVKVRPEGEKACESRGKAVG